jgi:YVTN family beta-propeller protein
MIQFLGTGFCLVATLGLGSISALASSPVTQYAYVTNTGAGTLSMINTVTDRVVNTVAVSGGYPEGAAITPDGQYVYLVAVGSNSTLVFDTSTQSIVNSIDMGNNNP